MAEITGKWAVLLRTTLPGTTAENRMGKITVRVFDSFAEAKDAFRETMGSYAFRENEMFDGEGHITRLEKFMMDSIDEDSYHNAEEYAEDYKGVRGVLDALNNMLAGKDVCEEDVPPYYSNWMVGARVEDGCLKFFGEDDGPCNGYSPYISTNVFTMNAEKEYHMHIVDLLGQDWPSEFFLNLLKV